MIHLALAATLSLLPVQPIEGAPPWKIEERMERYGVPGVSVAVWKDGRITEAVAYGNVKPNTLFQAGSISKSVAAVATLRVLQRRGISLDADVNKHLTSWKLGADGVSIEEILSHAAGLNVPGFPGFERGERIPTLVDELEGRGNTAALKVVGDASYSGGGYLLLQQLLIDLERKPIERILEDEVLRPAKMRDSTFVHPLPASWERRAARGRDEEGEAVTGGSYVFPEKTAAGLWATASDVARFVIALQKRRLLSAGLTETMLAKGLGVFPYRKHYFAHPGGNTGFAALYVATREGSSGVAVLANSETAEALIHEIVRGVAARDGWPDYVRAARKPVPLGDTTNIVGRYQVDADDVLAFSRDGGTLVVVRTARAAVRLQPLSANEFVDPESGDTYVFQKDEVTIGDKRLPRTRAAIPFELLARDPKLGLMQYDLLEPALRSEERLRDRGNFLRKQGNLAAAHAILEYNAKHHPNAAAAHDALATVRLAMGNVAGAREASQNVLEALAADPTPTASWRQVYRKRAQRRLEP